MISKELSLIGGSSFAQAREENRSHEAVVRPGGAHHRMLFPRVMRIDRGVHFH